ncbi:60S acidic ribosomal protein P2B [Glycine max]|nr:60S acidic ribosomal protein P2B [Glycine max]
MDETPRAENPSYILCLSTPAPLVSLCTNPNTKARSEIAIAIQRVVAAYLLAVLGGNPSPSADDIKHILGAVGAEAENELIELLLTEVKGKDFNELIASGSEKMSAVSGGGAAVAVAAAPAGGAAAPAAEAKEEKKVEEKEESDDDMGFSLFD